MASAPRYNMSGAWPNIPTEAIATLPALLAPAKTMLLSNSRDTAVCEATPMQDPQAISNICALLQGVPNYAVDVNSNFSNACIELDGIHGRMSAASKILGDLLRTDPDVFGGIPTRDQPGRMTTAPYARKTSPKISPSNGKGRVGWPRHPQPAKHASATLRGSEGIRSKTTVILREETASLPSGFKFWLQWDDPTSDAHDKWFIASISTQRPFTEAPEYNSWVGHYLLEFEADFTVREAFDLAKYASLKRLERMDGCGRTLINMAPVLLPPKRKNPESATVRVSKAGSSPAPNQRLAEFVESISKRVAEAASDLSSNNVNQVPVLTADGIHRLLSDIMLFEHNASGVGNDADHGDSLWGVSFDAWHTMILILDSHVQIGMKYLEDTPVLCRELSTYLDAALIVLRLATVRDRPKKLLIAESIDNILHLVRQILTQVLYSHIEPGTSSRSIMGASADAKTLVTAASQKLVVKLVGCCSHILDRLVQLCLAERLEDGMLCSLSSLGVSLFFVGGNSLVQMQLTGIELLCTLCTRFPQHRKMVLFDIIASFSKLPTSTKRHIRQFVIARDNVVQMVCALVLRLLQSYAGQGPTPISDASERATTFETRWDASASGYADALRQTKLFCSGFIKKCAHKKEEGDHRILLERFIDDLCRMLNLPSWPLAETMLHTLATMMISEVRETRDAKAGDNSYRGFLVEMIGLIACKVQDESILAEDPVSTDFLLSGVGGTSKETQLLTGSDGIQGKKRAQARMWVLRDAQANQSDAVAVHANIWLQTGAEEDTRENFSSLIVDAERDNGTKRQTVSANQITSCVRLLATQRELLAMQPMLLGTVLVIFNDSNITLRTKAVKVLSRLMETDARIFATEKVKHAVNLNCYDAASSVREATVDLIGRAMSMDERHADLYLETMLERVLDTGKSVRKRCIRILYDTLCANPLHQRAATILVKLAGRVDDENSIREMAIGAFRDLWFNPDLHPNMATFLQNSQTGQQPSNGAGAGLGAGNSVVLTLAQRVNQLLDVLRASQQLAEPRERNLVRVKLVSVINAILGAGDRGPERKPMGFVANSIDFSLEDMSEICGKMCDQLVENLLRIDECESDGDETRNLPGAMSPRMCCILALHLFCKSRHTFLCRHITTIEPYLQGGNGSAKEDTIVVQYCADMIRECLPHVANMEQHFVTTLERDLLKLIYTSPNQLVVQSCVRCYCTCFEWMLTDDTKIRRVLEQFYTAVSNYAPAFTDPESSKPAPRAPPTMLKAFFAMGLMCRYYDFDQIKLAPKKASGTSHDSTVERVAKICLLCAGSKCRNFNVQSRAMHALGNIFCRSPMLLLEPDVQDVLEGAMSSEKAATKQQVLQALTEVLVEDERKNQTKEAAISSVRKPKSKSIVDTNFCDTADDTKVKAQDTGLSGGLMQLYFKTMLKLAHDKTAVVRKDSVFLVGIILRQGLVHPMECVPHLVALESDRDEGVRAHVSRLLTHLDDKHHNLLRLRIVDGIFLSYEFQRRVFGTTDVIIRWRDTEEFAFARVYSFVKSKRTERNDFIKALVDKFVPEPKAPTDLPLLAYLCSVLTTLPLGCKDEVHFLLCAATRVLTLHATAISAKLKEAFSTTSDQAGADGGNAKPTREAARVLRPLHEDCRAGTAMCLMVKLKRYIKACYGITESQIILYSSAESKFEKPISRRSDASFTAEGLSLDVDDPTADGVLWKRFMQLREHLMDAENDDPGLLRTIHVKPNDVLQGKTRKRQSVDAASPKKKRGRKPRQLCHADDSAVSEDGDSSDEDFST